MYFSQLFSKENSLSHELVEVTGTKEWDKVTAPFPRDHGYGIGTCRGILPPLRGPSSLSPMTNCQVRIAFLKRTSTNPLTLKPAVVKLPQHVNISQMSSLYGRGNAILGLACSCLWTPEQQSALRGGPKRSRVSRCPRCGSTRATRATHGLRRGGHKPSHPGRHHPDHPAQPHGRWRTPAPPSPIPSSRPAAPELTDVTPQGCESPGLGSRAGGAPTARGSPTATRARGGHPSAAPGREGRAAPAPRAARGGEEGRSRGRAGCCPPLSSAATRGMRCLPLPTSTPTQPPAHSPALGPARLGPCRRP